jgi:ATP-binding cassette, subfamily F, member 3
MSIVRLEKVTKAYAGDFVLENVDFRIEETQKIGLIGRNGTGKTTLFRLITGETDPESGVIERMRKARIACLAQMPDVAPDATIHDLAHGPFAELIAWEGQLRELEHRMTHGDEGALEEYSHLQDAFSIRGGYEFRITIRSVLTGLGFSEADFALPFHALSGGQRTRLMLALVLLQDADLLLLDEPENHLDLEAREWLETFLQEWPRALVVISHDRRMLDAVAQTIVEVERGTLTVYTGNYKQYVQQKALRTEQHQKAFERQQEFVAKEESWINRFRYKNTKARQVQSRIKRLEKMELIDAPQASRATAKFHLGEVVRSGQVVLSAAHLSMAYGDLRLYTDISFQIERGERVGIIGPNGVGKTTLLRHLAGALPGGTGSVRLGEKVKLGFYDQHHDTMNPKADILSEVHAVKPAWVPEQIRSFMGRFLFTGEDVFKPIESLSGGERSRVAMAKLILGEANVLLLDEPTNHLDIVSREALEAALEGYPGTMIMVSHDRQLIDNLVTKLIVMEAGTVSVHLGNYSDFRWKTGGRAVAESPKATADVLRIRANSRRERQDGKAQRQQRKQVQDVEAQIESMEELIEALEQQFSQIDPADYARAAALKEEYDGLKGDLQVLYGEWERLTEE